MIKSFSYYLIYDINKLRNGEYADYHTQVYRYLIIKL